MKNENYLTLFIGIFHEFFMREHTWNNEKMGSPIFFAFSKKQPLILTKKNIRRTHFLFSR